MSKFERYRSFIAIVESGSLSTAANALFTTPSNISKQLARLEEDLGVQLMDRTSHKLSITEQGRWFYHRAKDITSDIEDVESRLKQQDAKPSGRLAISIPQFLLKTRLPLLLRDYSSLHPEVYFDLNVSNSTNDLVEDRIDFAFRVGSRPQAGTQSEKLGLLKTVICASPDYVRKHKNLTLGQLVNQGHFIFPSYLPAQSVRQILRIDQAEAIKDFGRCHRADDTLLVDELAIAGMGVTATFEIAVQDALQAGRLVPLFSSKNLPAVEIHLAYHKRKHNSVNVNLFREFVLLNIGAVL